MEYLVFIGSCLFGMVIGWLVFYFVRQFKDFDVSNLIKTSSLFLCGAGFCSLSAFMDIRSFLIALMAYLIGVFISFFGHLGYQFYIAKMMYPKFLNPRDRYTLLAGCNTPEMTKVEDCKINYKLEKICSAFEMLKKEKITEEEFKRVLIQSKLSKEQYANYTEGIGEYFIDSELSAYIDAKNYKEVLAD